MRLNYSTPLLFLLILIGCSKADPDTEIPEGQLELVWAVQPEEADEEPWFGEIKYVTVAGSSIYVSDVGRDVVIQLDGLGRFVRIIGRKGGGPGEFETDPAYVSVSPNGHLFVEHSMAYANEYSSSGDFIKRHVGRGLRIDTAPSIVLEWPIALDDSTLVWRVYPRGIGDLDDYLKVPPLVATRREKTVPLGERTLKEIERRALIELMSIPRNFLQTMWFTLGEAVPSHIQDEVLYLKDDDPYTVHRFSLSHPPTFFTFHKEERDDWIRSISVPREEYLERDQNVGLKFWGEKAIRSPNSNTIMRYNFTHMRRGFARYGKTLVVHVESITEEFKPKKPTGGFEQSLFLVNLSSEQTEMRIWVDPSFPYKLHGALEDGTLIFSTNDPVPGILAYRIIPN